MALFFFLLVVSGPLCVFFFLRPFRGLLLWGIQFLFFLLLLISHREQLLLVQGHQMPPKTSDSEKSVKREATLDSPLYLEEPLPRGEQKLQDEYVLDSRIHSRLNPPWNFRNLQKHSRRGLVMIFSKITRC